MDKKRYTRTDKQKALELMAKIAKENNMRKEDDWLLRRNELLRYTGKKKILSLTYDKKYIIVLTML